VDASQVKEEITRQLTDALFASNKITSMVLCWEDAGGDVTVNWSGKSMMGCVGLLQYVHCSLMKTLLENDEEVTQE